MIKKRGFFISIEGGEGAGKTTQTKLLIKYLKEKGCGVIWTQEPGGTRVGKIIRNILLNPRYKEIDRFAELFLYLADRSQHVKSIIMPSMKEGKVVISDRFSDATYAYQGFGRGINLKLISYLDKIATCSMKPDLTLYLDVGVKKGLKRASLRSSKDRIESEGFSFHAKVRSGYLAIARKESNRVKIISAQGSVQKIHQKIKVHIDKLLGRVA